MAALSTVSVAQCRSTPRVVDAGFWFDNVTFGLSNAHAERLGGPIDEQEKSAIASMAASELTLAYAGLRMAFSENPGAFYRVLVVQDFPTSGAAGQSRALGPFGGRGFVSFLTVAGSAMRHAPPNADRAVIIEGIGRGIGRTAAHEFAHQILGAVNIHASQDRNSYEYASADRPAQCYGPIHWDLAWPFLAKTLGR